MSGVDRIAAERARQIEKEGWTAAHDRGHVWGKLATAGAVYALPGHIREQLIFGNRLWKILWPWDLLWWKPSQDMGAEGRLRELEKAGALIAAEIDRILADYEQGR